MELEELIKELRYVALHLPWSQIRKDADEVVARVEAALKAQQAQIAELEAELIDERYRHDRVQDFEVAEAQELAKLRQERRWIPVGERLPKNGKIVLVFGSRGGIYTAEYLGDNYWHKLNSKSHYCNPTHWMPLPEPPEVDGR